jgi:hypothetical protein
MRWLQIFRLRFRSLFQRAAVERELEEEFRFHLEVQMERNMDAGMDPTEAREIALRELGHFTRHKEECRDARRTGMIESLWGDTRYAVRRLGRDPFLASVATLTLAACIGANTTLFSLDSVSTASLSGLRPN